MFGAIDDEDVHLLLPGLESQAELLTNGGED